MTTETTFAADGLCERLAPLIRLEIASIAAIDVAIAGESAPDYVVLLHDAKTAKQANVEQMATVIRAAEQFAQETGGLLKPLLKAQAMVLERLSRTATFRAMRLTEVELIGRYFAALQAAHGSRERRALRKALGRTIIDTHVLSAHIARESGRAADARVLPHPLGDYFASPTPRACMRCNLDRPGSGVPALERRDPHPFTYICAGCHADVLAEFPADLAQQIDRWPQDVRQARVIQRALGRLSKLNALHRVLFPLSGLEPERPAPAATRAIDIPVLTPVPGPAQGETQGAVRVRVTDDAEGQYCAQLFGYRIPRVYW